MIYPFVMFRQEQGHRHAYMYRLWNCETKQTIKQSLGDSSILLLNGDTLPYSILHEYESGLHDVSHHCIINALWILDISETEISIIRRLDKKIIQVRKCWQYNDRYPFRQRYLDESGRIIVSDNNGNISHICDLDAADKRRMRIMKRFFVFQIDGLFNLIYRFLSPFATI